MTRCPSHRRRSAGGQRLRAIWLRAESDAAQFLTFEDTCGSCRATTRFGIRCDRVCRPSERPAGGVAYHLGAAIPAGSLAVLLEQRR